MSILIHPRRWSMKPPIGVQLNGSHPLSAGLAGAWLFNEGGGPTITDLLGLNYGATVASPSWVPGMAGPSMVFNGSTQYVDLGSRIDPSGPFSVAYWIKPTSLTGSQAHIYLDGGNGADYLVVGTYTSGGQKVIATSGVANSTGFQSAAALPIGVWSHIAAVKTAGQVNKLYVNGLDVSTASGASWSPGTAAKRLIGGYWSTSVFALGVPAAFDFVAFWKRQLSAQEVQQLYTAPYCMMQAQSPQRRFWVVQAAISGTVARLRTLLGVGL